MPDTYQPFHSNWKQLAKGLGFMRVEECKKWIDSREFKPYWDELYECCLKPERDRAQAEGRPVQRGPDLRTVQACLEDADTIGSLKYTDPHGVDKTDWAMQDHLAYFLHQTVKVNKKSKAGLFSPLLFDKEESRWKIWQVYLLLNTQLAKSKQNKKNKGKNKDNSARGSAQPDSTQSRDRQDEDEDEDEETTDLHDDHTEPGSDEGEGEPDIDEDIDQGLEGPPRHQNDSNTNDNSRENDNTPHTIRTKEEMLLASKLSETMNLAEPYWQYCAIRIILKENMNPGFVQESLKYATDVDQMAAQSVTWERELGAWQRDMDQGIRTTPLVKFVPPTEEDLDAYKVQEERLRSLETERLSSTEAIKALDLEGKMLQIPGMPIMTTLRNWQIIAIHAAMVFQRQLTGFLLADLMGLGKTMVMIGHILQNIADRERNIANGRPVPPARPNLMVVPPNLIQQTIDKLRLYSELDVYVYYGGSRKKAFSNAISIQGLLTVDHEFFEDNPNNCYKIVVTSHPTLATRNGPSKVADYRISQGMRKQHATSKAVWENPGDFRCPHLIPGRFHIVWVDEAHFIKRADSAGSLAVQWLRPFFTGLATATPGVNRIQDFEGYLKHIRPRQQISDEQQAINLWGEHFNPYAVDKNHPAALLRLHEKYARKHIFLNNNSMEAGYNLARLNEMYMIRRTYASKVDGQMIGDAIPALVRRSVDLLYNDEDQKRYDLSTVWARRHLVTLTEDGKIIWNAKHFRTLILQSTWIDFEYIAHHIHADSLTRWKDEDNMLYEWLKLIPEAKRTFELPKHDDHISQISIVCQHSPKVSATLALVAEIVIKERRKVCLWTLLPAEQLLLWAILRKLKIDARMFSSDLSQPDRDQLIKTFNKSNSKAVVLINSFSMNSCGLDLQHQCSNTINFDIPMSRAIRDQADHRFRRFGQRNVVFSWGLSMSNTINDRQILNNLAKAAPGIMSELNSSIFEIDKITDDNNVTFSLGKWVILDDKLVPFSHPKVAAAGLDESAILDPSSVIKQILCEEYGTWVEIETLDRPEANFADV